MNGSVNQKHLACRNSGDWFNSRRNHCLRRMLNDSFDLIQRFQGLYAHYLEAYRQHPVEWDRGARAVLAAQDALLGEVTDLVGSEQEHGPLWQQKDLCHRIWPRQGQDQPTSGLLFDWLVGSLFHEAMKLKENLYLLCNYGAVDPGSPPFAAAARLDPVFLSIRQERGMLIGRLAADAALQLEKLAFLFGWVAYILRLMLTDLLDNPLVVRLLADREQAVAEIWGESLEQVFNDLFAGSPAEGFCLAGACFFQGQWYQAALAMYQRALLCDRYCDAARVRIAHLGAIVQQAPEDRNRTEETFNP